MSELMVDNNDKPQFRHENNVFSGVKLKTYDKVYIQGNFLSGDKIDKNTKQGKWLTVYPAKGRLGNQMFQIASVLGIADKFNYRPFIPLTNFDIYPVFEMPNPTKKTIDLSESLKYQESNISTHEECDVTTYSDLSFLKGDMNWTLDGYLQSFKYFWKIQNINVQIQNKDDLLMKVLHRIQFKIAWNDLAAMSLCDHMIISVGTFGWWGGWLAGGSVIYFNGYPKPGSEISKYFVKDDFYPPFWIGIT
ncbi:uncharacterized protein LOC132743491 [Ruditapes philippinarum]|uniref:uncharacterized protein LOC132743491 n=1 Tax=Ruditapes philippinarum TaxID=129788 RepID=UPI00295B7BDE|nr:uncharacterized protein LOC132743491 [Ruditapes philippinarum]